MSSIIEIPISPDPISGLARVARHLGFLIDKDGELVQQIQVVTLNAEGKPLLENLETLEHLSDSQRTVAMSRYADTGYTRQTRGAFVDVTGQPVTTNPETGELPAGAVSQRDFFGAISLGMLKKQGFPVTDKTTVVELVYALIKQEMASLDKRGVY